MANISPGAHIAGSVQFGQNVTVGPGCIIKDNVVIGDNCELRSNVLVCSGTTLGANNRVFHGVVLGEEPQNIGEIDPDTRLTIGDNNVFREYVTIHRGSTGGSGNTIIGNKNFIMANSHVAHDCSIGNNVVMTNSCNLAGHVTLGDNSWLAGGVQVHQFTTIGKFAYVGGASNPSQDIPPFMKSSGWSRCHPRAVNSIGLERNGFSSESILAIKKAFKLLFINKEKRRVESIVDEMLAEESIDENVRYLLEFLNKSYKSPKRRFKELERKK